MTLALPVAPLPAHVLLVFLLQVSLLLTLAILLGCLAMRFGMPAVVGELCVGVLLGPSLLGHLAPGLSDWLLPQQNAQFSLLDAVGQLGVLLLVGITGIEVDFKLIRRRAPAAMRVSLAGLVVPLGFGVATGFLLPISLLSETESSDRLVFALFLGVAMCVSAIPVIAKTLSDMNLLHRNIGQLTLVAGMIDDIFGWLMLSVISAMATTGLRSGGVASAVRSLLFLAVLIILAVTVGRRLVRGTLRTAARAKDSTPTIGVAVIVILLCAAATQAMGFEAVFGAFVGGLLIGSSGTVDLARLAPLRTMVMAVFAPLFFATAGLRMDLTALAEPVVLLAAVVILLIAVLGKFLGAFIGAKFSGLNRWEALALGAGMNARGVVEVVVAMVGLRLGVLNTETYTIVVLVAVMTSLMAPPVLRMAMRRVEHTAEEELRRRDWEGFRGEAPA